MKKKIFLVDHDVVLSKFLSERLVEEEAGFEVKSFERALEVIDILKSDVPDLIIMEYGFKNVTGNTALEEILKIVNVPVIILTSNDDTNDVINAYNIGATDYITKPFEYSLLLERINSRLFNNPEKDKIVFKDLVIDLIQHRVFKDGKDLKLTAKEYYLLKYLVENKGHLITRDKILDRVWKSEKIIISRCVDIYIARLRKKLKDKKQRYIKTHVGFGYIVPRE